MNKISRYH